MTELPKPTASMQAHSAKLAAFIKQQIQQQQGLSFADFMQAALYTPGLGYYSAGSTKLGSDGDFITAPEISPLFSYCLAEQCLQVFAEIKQRNILEFGAGSGQMACDILTHLKTKNCLPENYFILEVSPDLQQRQQQKIQATHPELIQQVTWLSELPKDFCGVVLANEVLDAMPVHIFQQENNELLEYFVDLNDSDEFSWRIDKASPVLQEAFAKIQTELPTQEWQQPYTSEINLAINDWINAISNSLKQGLVLLIDYGYPRAHYYHPQRSKGTLLCHYQHRAHDNPLILAGLQDITAHVDFTAVADSGTAAGLTLEGFCSQASFLINCGLDQLCQGLSEEEQFKANAKIKRLTHPNEMGDVFKVIGLSRGLESFLKGFDNNDLSNRL